MDIFCTTIIDIGIKGIQDKSAKAVLILNILIEISEVKVDNTQKIELVKYSEVKKEEEED